MSETIQLATVLTTDLVGSTRLAMAVGPARADELRDEHFALLREVIEVHGGHEAKNTGDGLVVAFGSASAAVRCAVLMQQTFERRYRRAEQPLHVRIGMGAGESTVQDGDYFGLPSIEAARLCAQAEADGILVSPAVRMLAGRIEDIEFRPVGPLQLKGFEESMEPFAVEWTPLADEAEAPTGWPLPPVLRSAPAAAYAGREAERGLIDQARAEVRRGARRVVLLSGEPGIGKSRLSAWSALRAHGDGFAVLWGSCSEELVAPYEPWIAACSQLVEHAPADVLEAHVRRCGGDLARLARGLRVRVPGAPEPQASDPETERYLLFAAVSGALEALAAGTPVCLVLDDLHWADAQTVALLKHVARETEGCPLQIIVAYRDSDVGKDHPLAPVLADLRRIDGVERIALQGLEAEDVAHILAAAAGHELDEDGLLLAGEIAAETNGNPFFVGEVLRSLLESGRLLFDEETQRWTVDRSEPLELPESVRDVVERRVGALGPGVRDVLTTAAVIGRSFDLELLLRLVDTDEPRLLDHLEAAVAASLLDESSERLGRFRFVHALINQTLYESLGATRRARMHRHVAEALEDLLGDDPGERVAELAQHWGSATAAVDVPKAISYARRAGQRALDELAPGEAVRWFQRALELGGRHSGMGDGERCDLLISLGEAQRQAGEPTFRETLLQAAAIASEQGDAQRAARAALANSRGQQSSFGAVDAERMAALQRALELNGDTDPASRARLLSLQGLELQLGPGAERAQALAREAIDLARDAGSTRALGDVLRNAILTLVGPDVPLPLRAALADELLVLAEQLGDPALRFWAEVGLESARVESGDLTAGLEAADRRRVLANELGQPTLTWSSAYFDACFALTRGELERAEHLTEEALRYGIEGKEPDALMIYGSAFGALRYMQGRSAEIVDLMVQGVEANPGMPAWRGGLAAIFTGAGRHDEALTIVRDAARDGFAHVPPDQIFLTTLALYADAAAQLGDPAVAETLYRRLEPYRGRVAWVAATSYGFVDPYLGLLAAVCGWDAKADEHLARGCELNEREGIRFWAAHGRLGWAEALARRGEHERATEQAQRALELARGQGYEAVEQRAEAVLAGVAPAS